MAARTFECSACGATVPYGRLSCPACGELLASVAGGRRGELDVEPIPGAPSPTADEPASYVDRLAAASAAPWPDPDDPDGPDALDASPTLDASPVAWPNTPSPPDLPGAHLSPATSVAAGSYVPPATPVAAGSYVPPGPISPAIEATPAGPPAPARAWGGLAALGSGGTAGVATADGRSRAEDFDLRDPARRAAAIGWLGVVGAAIAAVGFLLPWAATMIGSGGVSYVDQWGLAGPAHVLVVLGLVAIAVLGVVENPVPAWVRLGIPGVAVGSLLVGLAWPYLFGPLGGRPGLLVSFVGALLLVAAGIICLVADRLGPDVDPDGRHGSPDRPV